jgi:hypothetical protein
VNERSSGVIVNERSSGVGLIALEKVRSRKDFSEVGSSVGGP